MAKDWFAKIGGQVIGPMEAGELRAMAAVGRLSEADDVRRGNGAWLAAMEVDGLQFGHSASAVTSRSTSTGGCVAIGVTSVSSQISEPSKRTWVWWTLVGVATLLVLGGIGQAIDPDSGDRNAAIVVSEAAVKDVLKSPATAAFVGDTVATRTGDGEWRVSGEVDSQNSFGAMLRSTWVVIAKKRNGEWSASVSELKGR